MSNPIVSIIMPIYGVEKYVGKAIDSIRSQSLSDWELFCVDDGSKDRSGEICDEYAKKDPRIKVIHKENGGAPSARNVAIDKANGKYFYFMDADDWAESTMLSDMVSICEEHSLELLISGYYIDTYYSDKSKFTQEQFAEDIIYSSAREFHENAHMLFDLNLLYTPWNKLYLAEYIKSNKLYFPQTFWDDFPFNLSVIRDVTRVGVTSEKYYHFIRKRAESETAKYRPEMYDKREEEAEWLYDLYDHWDFYSDEVDEVLSRRYIERLIGCVENITNKNCTMTKRQKKKEIKRIIKTKRVRKTIKAMNANSRYMKIMLIPIKYRMVWLTYLEGVVISFVKSHSTRIFAKLKANR